MDIAYLYLFYEPPVKGGPISHELGSCPFEEFNIVALSEPINTGFPAVCHAICVKLDGASGTQHFTEIAADTALPEHDRGDRQVDGTHRAVINAETTFGIAALFFVPRHFELKSFADGSVYLAALPMLPSPLTFNLSKLGHEDPLAT